MYSWKRKCILGPTTRDSPFKIPEQVGLKTAYSVNCELTTYKLHTVYVQMTR